MPRPVRHKQRQALYGWLKWTPLFIAVFSALFFDAYLNLATRENDYVLNQLTKEKKELKTSLNDVRSRAAGTEKLEMLQVQAAALGLEPPEPEQIETFRYDPVRGVVVDDGFERTTLALAAPLDVPAPRPAAALSEEALAATSGPATLDQAPGEAFPWRRTRASQKQPKAVDGPAAPKEERPETPAPRSRRHAQASNEPVNLDESVDSLLASL